MVLQQRKSDGELDWYNNEHVPLRLNHLSSFLTGARFRALDSLNPSWLAVYDIDDTATFQHESYTRLRANRSPREADLVRRLELLDRRTYGFVSDSGESSVTSSYKPDNPTKVLVTHFVDVPDGAGHADTAFKAWADSVLHDMSAVEGWVRTRTYKCIDNLKSGTSVPTSPEAQIVPKYLAVHGKIHSLLLSNAHSADCAIFYFLLQNSSLPPRLTPPPSQLPPTPDRSSRSRRPESGSCTGRTLASRREMCRHRLADVYQD
jgi:hypothetical protein